MPTTVCFPFLNVLTIARGDIMKAHKYDQHHAGERSLPNPHCPKCGSREIVPRTVNDVLRAADPRGKVFEVGLQLQVWRCGACKLCWQGQEAMAAKEAAYQIALVSRSPSRITA